MYVVGRRVLDCAGMKAAAPPYLSYPHFWMIN